MISCAAVPVRGADNRLLGSVAVSTQAGRLDGRERVIESTLRAMMTTPHLGEAGVHPVVASAARELRNKSENERSGVLSTAMSFLGLYRDPVVAEVTRRCDWRITDIVGDKRPTTLYLVVPPSDISRTKPLIRLILNQIGRRLTDIETASGARVAFVTRLGEGFVPHADTVHQEGDLVHLVIRRESVHDVERILDGNPPQED
mgnify:CR=1 FL=1